MKDITYCICDCVFKRCDRHADNIPENTKVQIDYLFNTDYCPMKIKKNGSKNMP